MYEHRQREKNWNWKMAGAADGIRLSMKKKKIVWEKKQKLFF